jgi:hypothetical protein
MKSTVTHIKEYLSKAMYHIYPNVKLLLPFTILKISRNFKADVQMNWEKFLDLYSGN